MTEHEQHADKLEHELEDMEERSQRLEHEIDDTRSDWEAKKRDGSVPGAAGEPERAEGDPPPEQQYPTKRET
jgi:predicted  nucleic acid-binding Zn-ribbon protein